MQPESIRRKSALELYSLGAVVETKALGSDIIKVTPIEDFAFENGFLNEIKKRHNVVIPDSIGRTKKADVEGGVTIEAKWIPFGHSNRISAPDVVKNETVVLFRFGSNDTYYWSSIFREPSLRRLEKVLYAWSNIRDGIGKKVFDRLTSYWMEVSTFDKWIWLKTNKNDGEPFAYDVKIDTKRGNIEIKDSAGEFFRFDSATGTLSAKMNTKIYLEAPDIHFKANNGILSEAQTIRDKASTSVTHETPQVNNTGNMSTSGNTHTGGNNTVNGSSTANPHYHYAP